MKKSTLRIYATILILCAIITPVSVAWTAPRVNHAEKAYEAGVMAYNQGEYQKAVYAFQNSIGYNDRLYKSHYMLGLALFMNNEPHIAESVLMQAIEEFPKEWKAQAILAEYYAGQKKYESAINYYQNVLDVKGLPRKEKKEYQTKLEEITAERAEQWRVSEEEKDKILSQIKLPIDMKSWRPALVEKRNTDLHVAYLPKDEDLTNNRWRTMIDVLCKAPNFGGFQQINQETADQYRELGGEMNTLEQIGDSRIFETRLSNKTYIVGRLYKSSIGYCLVQVMKKSRFKTKETDDWVNKLKTVLIQSPNEATASAKKDSETTY